MFTSIKSLLRVSNILFATVLILSSCIVLILATYDIEDTVSVSGYIDENANYKFQYDPDVLPHLTTNTDVILALPETKLAISISYIDPTAHYAICNLDTDQGILSGSFVDATIGSGEWRSLGSIMISRYFTH